MPPAVPSPSVGPHQRLTPAAGGNSADTASGLAGRVRTALKSSVRELVMPVIPVSSHIYKQTLVQGLTCKDKRGSDACQEAVDYRRRVRPRSSPSEADPVSGRPDLQ